MSPGHGGHMSPGHASHFYSGAREPAGYFDAAYFPPMAMGGGAAFGAGAGSVLGASGLAHEILKDAEEMGRVTSDGERAESDEVNKGGERESREAAEVEGRALNEGEIQKEDGKTSQEKGENSGDKRVRRHSSTMAMSWQSTVASGEGDMCVWEGREGGAEGHDSESALEDADFDALAISRTHSMSSSKKPVDGPPQLVHRSDSDPLTSHASNSKPEDRGLLGGDAGVPLAPQGKEVCGA